LFLTSHGQAISRRLQRNYCWMFLILLFVLLVKTTVIKMHESAVEARLVGSADEWVRNAAVATARHWAGLWRLLFLSSMPV
jgi:uncharacterized membrane protein